MKLIAQTYLLGGTTNGVPAIDTSGNGITRIQLVVLIVYTGKRPDPADKSIGAQDYDENDYIDSTKITLKPLSVRIEFWRLKMLRPEGVRTRSWRSQQCSPVLDESVVAWPDVEKDTMTMYTSDFLGWKM